jgi:hypothetical protein
MPGLAHRLGEFGTLVTGGGGGPARRLCPEYCSGKRPAESAAFLTRQATALSKSVAPVIRPTLVTAQSSGHSAGAS